MRTPVAIFLLLALSSASACNRGDNLARVEVKGRVTNEGQAVERGLITFRPADGASGPAAGTGIEDGRYHIGADRGPIAGDYVVEIKLVGKPAAAPARGAENAAMIRSVRLKSFSQPVEIRSDENMLDFALPLEAKQGH